MPLPLDKTTEEEALHREMERISLDWVMIQNPTDTDFYIEWHPWKHLVPNRNKDIGWGKGKLEVQRYLAVWYCRHMKDQILNERGQKEYDKMIEARRDKGLPDLTKFEEQKALWEKTPKTNSDTEMAALYPLLFLGVTREFGQDFVESQGYEVNQESLEEKQLKKLQYKKYTNTEEKPSVQAAPPVQAPEIEDLEALMPKRTKANG